MGDLDERLRSARAALERMDPPDDLWVRALQRSSTNTAAGQLSIRRRPSRTGLVAAMAIAASIALVLTFAPGETGRRSGERPSEPRADAAAPLETGTAPSAAEGAPSTGGREGWQAMAPSPLTGRAPAVSVWTGEELIVWRGDRMPPVACVERDAAYCGEEPLRDSAAYRPSTDTWRPLPAPPSTYESTLGADAAVWTGTEMIVWGGSTHAAAYDPESNRWRRIADPPFPEAHDSFTMTWTGREAVLVTAEGVAAYDPAEDSWNRLPSLAQSRILGFVAVWTRAGLVVVGGSRPGGGSVDAIELLVPGADRWKTIGTAPQLIEAAAVWTGRLVVIVGRTDFASFTAATIDVSTGAWTPLNQPPVERFIAPSLVWTGTEAILVANGRRVPSVADQRVAVGWSPTSGEWRHLPEAEGLKARSGAAVAWTGSEMIVWGGFVSDVFAVGEPLSDGARYTPPGDWDDE